MIKQVALHTVKRKTCLLIVMAVLLLISVYKDARNAKVVPNDMRNRITGSRMMKDGASPYFYIWKEGDPIRYYDPYIPFSLSVSRVTSTPFFHYAFGLIADLPQYQLSTIWFFLEYFFLGICLIMAILTIPTKHRKIKTCLLAGIAVFFTYTYGWHLHVFAGQNYILIPVMAMGCYYSLVQKEDLVHLLLFALFACSLVLLRPTAILFFLPFLFFFKTYFKWLCSALALMLLYTGFVLSNPIQKANWKDYFKSLPLHVKYHQGQLPQLQSVPYNPDSIHRMEGVDLDFSESYYWVEQHESEYHNFSYIIAETIGKRVTVKQMTIIGIISCLCILLPLWIGRKRKLSFSPAMLFLLGFVVYNTYEFFSPVARSDYNWVQFIFPLLLTVVLMKRLYLFPAALLIVGIYLNVVVWHSVTMEHRIGELVIVVAILFLVYRELIMQYVKEDRLRISSIYIA